MCFALCNLKKKKRESNLSLFVTPGFLKSHWMLKISPSSRGDRWACGREKFAQRNHFSSSGTKKGNFEDLGERSTGSITYKWITLHMHWCFKDERWSQTRWAVSFHSSLLWQEAVQEKAARGRHQHHLSGLVRFPLPPLVAIFIHPTFL